MVYFTLASIIQHNSAYSAFKAIAQCQVKVECLTCISKVVDIDYRKFFTETVVRFHTIFQNLAYTERIRTVECYEIREFS